MTDTPPPSAFTVYTYPSQFSPGDISHPGEPATTRTQSGERPVEGLEQLFIRGMPAWKRAMDIVGSLLGLILLSPLFLVIAIVIKTVSPGPVFYKQERLRHQGKNFTMLKFRTMRVNADNSIHQKHLKKLINGDPNDGADKPMTKLDNDPQIIPLGKIIRKSCIDELPQLINVFRGEMSLVGPRPALPYEVQEYLHWNDRRLDITPGMTGLWQVSGKNRTTFKEMIRLDINYATQLSFWLDVKILFMTVPAIILQVIDSYSKKDKENAESV